MSKSPICQVSPDLNVNYQIKHENFKILAVSISLETICESTRINKSQSNFCDYVVGAVFTEQLSRAVQCTAQSAQRPALMPILDLNLYGCNMLELKNL